MKKILTIIFLGLMFSGNVYAEEIILKCESELWKGKDGKWESIKGEYTDIIIINTDKKNWRYSNTKLGGEHPLIITDEFFGTYSVASYIYGKANPTISIGYTEINRYNGKSLDVETKVPVPVGKKLQKLDNGRSKTKAYEATKSKAISYSQSNIKESRKAKSNCKKTKKAF